MPLIKPVRSPDAGRRARRASPESRSSLQHYWDTPATSPATRGLRRLGDSVTRIQQSYSTRNKRDSISRLESDKQRKKASSAESRRRRLYAQLQRRMPCVLRFNSRSEVSKPSLCLDPDAVIHTRTDTTPSLVSERTSSPRRLFLLDCALGSRAGSGTRGTCSVASGRATCRSGITEKI